MVKPLFFLFLFFCSYQSYSQKLVYKSNGNITDSENNKISPNGVRALLANNEKLLADYNAGRKKKTIGNVLLIGGSALIGTVLTVAVLDFSDKIHLKNSTKNYVTALNYVGIAALVVAIPVKIGFSKKIENVVTKFNNQATTGYKQFNNQKLDLITNSNGIGLRLTLN
jgi:hypothetical protein